MVSHNTVPHKNTDNAAIFRKKMLGWYDRHRRVLPWRTLPDEHANSYHVWLSEIMLQQTTVQAVIPYFLKFTEKWPNIETLANADNDDVMSNWAGLGYYARARNLHKCAQTIVSEYQGHFPSDERALKALPGIGDYTAAAIRSIVFDKPATVVDGNVERIMARYHAVEEPVPAGKKTLKKHAHFYADNQPERCSDYAQSLMDLGATICTPKSPACALCPINDGCIAYANKAADLYPKREKKQTKPKRLGYVYWVTNNKGDVLLHKRPEKGLLGGMYGLPTTPWIETEQEIRHLDIFDEDTLKKTNHIITHVFTHFHLTLDIYSLSTNLKIEQEEYAWHDLSLDQSPSLPTTFEKVRKIML